MGYHLLVSAYYKAYRRFEILQILVSSLRFRRVAASEYSVRVGGYDIFLSRAYAAHFARRWKSMAKSYLPAFPLQGKTVLDCGAGEGETALLYFLNGASKVVCIESNHDSVRRLRRTAQMNNWNVDIIEEEFELDHLNVPHDFMKFKIPGRERIFLDYHGDLGHCVLAVFPIHSRLPDLDSALMRRFGMKRVFELRVGLTKAKVAFLMR